MTNMVAAPKYAWKYSPRERGSTGIGKLRTPKAINRGDALRRALVRGAGNEVTIVYHAHGSFTADMEHVATADVNNAIRGRELAIDAAAEEAKSEGWDGYGGLAVSREAVDVAKKFARLLPIGMSEAEIGPSPHGSITFDWYLSAGRNLSVSVGPGRPLAYAGILQTHVAPGAVRTEVTHGEIEQPINEFPAMIAAALRLLYAD